MTSPSGPSGSDASVDDAGPIGQTTGAGALLGGALRSVSLLLPQIFVVVLSVVAARILGPELMGRQSFIAFVEMTAIIFASMGLNTAVLRTVAVGMGEGRSAQIRGLFPWAVALASLSGCLVGLAVGSISLLAAHDQVAWILAGCTAAIGTVQAVPSAFLTGLQKWSQATVAGLCTGGVSVLAAIIVLWKGGGIAGLFTVELATMSVNAIWTGALARQALTQIAPAPEPPGVLRRRTLQFAMPTALIAILDLVVWKRSEFIFLAHFSTAAEVAQYSIAFAAITAVSVVPVALTSLISSIATLHGAGASQRIQTGFARSVRLLLWAVIPVTAGVLSVGPLLVTSVYGESYATAGRVLRILTLFFPLLALQYLCDAFLAGTGRRRVRVLAVAAGAAVNVILGFALIPGGGAIGAAISNGSAQVVAAAPIIASAFRNQRLRRHSLNAAILSRVIIVAFASGMAAQLIGSFLASRTPQPVALLCAILAGLSSWICMARLLRVLSYDDGEWLLAALPLRLRALGSTAVRAISQPKTTFR